jgi:AraC-like DNA-binding protein
MSVFFFALQARSYAQYAKIRTSLIRLNFRLGGMSAMQPHYSNPSTLTETALTISGHFLEAMFRKTRAVHGDETILNIFRKSNIPEACLYQPELRISRAQFIAAYKANVVLIDDEMHGLWSRPIRSGTLKYLMLSVLDAANIAIALNRFTRFWNLLLDDYKLSLAREHTRIGIILKPRIENLEVNVLGHELMMRLAHGIISWLLNTKVELENVQFAFPQPEHFSDYAFLYPGPVTFNASYSALWLDSKYGLTGFRRTRVDLWAFLRRAPEDWAFTTVNTGLFSTKVRKHLAALEIPSDDVDEVSNALGLSTRTLTRKLQAEGTSFRIVRDHLRRDLAVQLLTQSRISIDGISALVGFENTAAFCRAFKGWMQVSPGAYRNRNT